jgi:hypothetical protein
LWTPKKNSRCFPKGINQLLFAIKKCVFCDERIEFLKMLSVKFKLQTVNGVKEKRGSQFKIDSVVYAQRKCFGIRERSISEFNFTRVIFSRLLDCPPHKHFW